WRRLRGNGRGARRIGVGSEVGAWWSAGSGRTGGSQLSPVKWCTKASGYLQVVKGLRFVVSVPRPWTTAVPCRVLVQSTPSRPPNAADAAPPVPLLVVGAVGSGWTPTAARAVGN